MTKLAAKTNRAAVRPRARKTVPPLVRLRAKARPQVRSWLQSFLLDGLF